MANVLRTNVHCPGDAGVNGISAKTENMKIQGLQRNNFLASRRWHYHPRLLKLPIN